MNENYDTEAKVAEIQLKKMNKLLKRNEIFALSTAAFDASAAENKLENLLRIQHINSWNT